MHGAMALGPNIDQLPGAANSVFVNFFDEIAGLDDP